MTRTTLGNLYNQRTCVALVPGLNTLARHGVRPAQTPISISVWLLAFSGFHAMVLLLLPKLSTRPNRVPCNGIQYYELLTRCLLGFNIGNELAFFVSLTLRCSWTATWSPICLVLVASLLKLVLTRYCRWIGHTCRFWRCAVSVCVLLRPHILIVVIIQGMLVRLEVRHTFH